MHTWTRAQYSCVIPCAREEAASAGEGGRRWAIRRLCGGGGGEGAGRAYGGRATTAEGNSETETDTEETVVRCGMRERAREEGEKGEA